LAQNKQVITTNTIVSFLLERGIYIITPRDLAALLQMPLARAYYFVRKLKARGWIMPVVGGRYLVVGFEPYRVTTHPFFIAVSLVIPSYVSFLTALNYYGLTEQVPFTIFVAATVKHRHVTFGQYTFQYVHLKPLKFFGYSKIMDGDLPILMADPEKALLDSLDQIRYHYGGAIDEVTKALFRGAQSASLDWSKLVDYAIRMKSKATCARLGYLHYQMGLSSPEFQRLKEFLPQGFVPLDPTRPLSTEWNAEWKINVNVSRAELLDFMGGVR